MAKIRMAQIYSCIRASQIEALLQARTDKQDHFKYTFAQFSKDVRANDLITSKTTIKDKWDNAVSDGVIIPAGKDYTFGVLIIPELAHKLHMPETCVCMCVSDGIKYEKVSQ